MAEINGDGNFGKELKMFSRVDGVELTEWRGCGLVADVDWSRADHVDQFA